MNNGISKRFLKCIKINMLIRKVGKYRKAEMKKIFSILFLPL